MKFYSFAVLLLSNGALFSQHTISGITVDSVTKELLPFVNIGIKQKNIGTISSGSGTFSIGVPEQYKNDSLTFSMVGYEELILPVNAMSPGQEIKVQLRPKTTQLKEVNVTTKKLIEKKIGLKKNNTVVHFIDASISQNDIFEIAQVMQLGRTASKITSVNLRIAATNADSATFRLNFYGYDGDFPTTRLINKNIVQTHAIKEGWLKFDLSPYAVFLKNKVVVSIEFIPGKKRKEQISYEIKIGGSAKSFARKSSQGEWNVPPAHYRMFITALVPENNSDAAEDEEKETVPALHMFSEFVRDSFSVFIQLPGEYERNKSRKYPVAYLLDGNVYFDAIGNSIKRFTKKGLLSETILVGIGYKDFYTGDSLRDRDYTSLQALPGDSFSVSGGAANFLAFLEKELVPYIDKTYRSDTTKRIIMGHSLGGHFSLYVLSKALQGEPNLFNGFIAGSPSLGYHDNYILQQFQPLTKPDPGQRSVYITMGSLEDDEKLNYESLSKELSGNNFEGLDVKTEIYPGCGHMETAISTFEKGMQFVFGENKRARRKTGGPSSKNKTKH